MSKLTYISLFSSAGVGCYGFKMEGFDCVATNELLPKRLEVQKCNNKCLATFANSHPPHANKPKHALLETLWKKRRSNHVGKILNEVHREV